MYFLAFQISVSKRYINSVNFPWLHFHDIILCGQERDKFLKNITMTKKSASILFYRSTKFHKSIVKIKKKISIERTFILMPKKTIPFVVRDDYDFGLSELYENSNKES